MRIVAKKKDYYDCIQAYGQDQSLVYVRTPEVVPFSSGRPGTSGLVNPFPRIYFYGFYRMTNAHSFIVGFCGKIYPLVSLRNVTQSGAKRIRCFTLEEVDAYIDEHLKKKERDYYYGKIAPHLAHRFFRTRTHYDFRRDVFVKFFERCAEKQDAFAHMFEEKRCPVFFAGYDSDHRGDGDGQIEYNALLGPHEYYRVFDPYQAYQEINMFMSNLAVPEKQMPIIPDDMKIHSHGFNQWSFRRPPGGK